MKQSILKYLLIVSLFYISNITYSQSLVAYYTLNGDANDYSGNNLNGIAQAGLDFSASDRFEKPGKAIHITSPSQYIRIPHADILDLQKFTILSWVKRDIGINTSGAGGIFNNGNQIDHFSLVAKEDVVRTWINYPVSPDDEHAVFTDVLADEEYHFVATTYDGEIRKTYVDGELIGTMLFSEPIDYSLNEDCFIGMNFPGGGDWFAGYIDEVCVFDGALSDEEVNEMYEDSKTPSPLSGHITNPSGYHKEIEDLCDIINDGIFSIPEVFSDVSNYWTSMRYTDPIDVTGNFSIEIRVKNNAADGGNSAFDTGLNLYSENYNAWAYFMGADWGIPFSSMGVNSDLITQDSILLIDLEDWRKIQFKKVTDSIQYFVDGNRIGVFPLERICKIDSIRVSFNGTGQLDYILISDFNNNPIYFEDFKNCKELANPVESKNLVQPQILGQKQICLGDQLLLYPQINLDIVTSYWINHDNDTINSDTLFIDSVDQNHGGNYLLYVNDGCNWGFDTITADVFTPPLLELSLVDTSICIGESIILDHGFPDSDINYLWEPSQYIIDGTGLNVEILPTKSTVFRVSATDSIGCHTSDSFSVKVDLLESCVMVDIPNIFTPNGDDFNDMFNIVYYPENAIKLMEVLTFKVFNRWGQQVYDNQYPTQGWDGRFNGKQAPEEVYGYIIEISFIDGSERKYQGDVTLLR